jgi:opacity protein-like surface antigen
MRKILLVCAISLAFSASAQAAEICETVNDAANAWNEMGNLIRATGGEGFDDSEVAQIEDAVGGLTEATALLAGALQSEGNAEQQGLGEELEAILTVLADDDASEDADYLVAVLDEVTKTMDSITDDCDAHQ